MSGPPRPALAVWVGLLLAMGVFTFLRLELSTAMADLVPEATDRELSLVAGSLVDSPVTRTMVLHVGASDLDAAIDGARRWQEVLEGHPEVASLRSGPDAALPEAVRDLYQPRRLLFLSSRPEDELPGRLSDAGLRRAARALRRELSLPTGALVKEVAPADPLLAFPALLRRLEQARRGPLEVVEGRFVDRDGSSAILFLTTRHSAFDAASQAPFGVFLEESFAELARELPGGLRLQRSSVHRFAAAAERDARRDVRRISGLSLAGSALALLLLFRSPRLLALSLLPLVAGLLSATSVGILLFGRLHVMTLAFGATLIGVCIDYPVHYLSHHLLLERRDPWTSMRRVFGAIALGAATTMAGFAVFAGGGFPLVRQIGVFATTGILGALVTTRLLLPRLLSPAPPLGRLRARALAATARLLEGLARRRAALWAVPLLAGAVLAAGLPRARWEDDVFALGRPPQQDWVEEDARVRASVSHMDAGRFVVAFGDDAEAALQRNDVVFERLRRAREEGRIEDFRSLHPFLPSASLQRRNLAVLSRQPDLPRRALDALAAEGFHREAFRPFARSLEAGSPEPLRYEDLLGSPLAEVVAPFRLDVGDRVAILSLLRAAPDAEGLAALFADLEDVHYFDQRGFLAEVARRHRGRSVRLLGVGLLAVALLLQLRTRRLRAVLATLAPSVLAAGLTLALLSLLGIRIDLLHLLGLLLVLSIGVDYAIFLGASGSDAPARAAALLGIGVACLSTCLAFGLLATSSFPALRALGLATTCGVALSLVLAPAVLLLLRPRPEDGPGSGA